MADRKVQPALSGLTASIWKHCGFYKVDGESELTKSHTTWKLCHSKINQDHHYFHLE